MKISTFMTGTERVYLEKDSLAPSSTPSSITRTADACIWNH